MGKILAQKGTVYTLQLWNTVEFKNHPEISIAGVDAAIRLLCTEPINFDGRTCSAHFYDIAYFTTKAGEQYCRVCCNACSIYKARRVGQGSLNGSKGME